MSTRDATARDHADALAVLRDAARRTAGGLDPAGLEGALDDAAAARGASPAAGALARTYVFAARVGAAAADADRAATWLRGWAGAARRTPQEVHAAVVDGVRFAERLHRALGVDGS